MSIQTSKGEYAQIVVSPTVKTSVAISGQIKVTTAGTEVQGSNVSLDNGVWIKALNANTGLVFVGNNGSGVVSSSTGFELAAGELVLVPVANLNEIWVDSAVNGEGVCWLKA